MELSAECIYDFVFFAFHMLDFKIKLTQDFDPPGLSSMQAQLIKQILQDHVIYSDLELSSKHIMPPHFEGMYYGC